MIGIKTLHWNPGDPYPVSPVKRTPWDKAILTADCASRTAPGSPAAHPPIQEACACGIYAVNAWFTLIDVGGCFNSPYAFTCVLDPHGKVIVHQKGWRAEKVSVVGVGRAVCFCGHSDLPALRAAQHFGVSFLETQEIIDILVADAYSRGFA